MPNLALTTGLKVGAVTFAIGFVGPMILDPSSGNGPLLGIFITGPIGFALGVVWGWWLGRRDRASKKNVS